MRLSQVFDDLGEFVRHYRGRISSDGLLLYTDTSYLEGTVLDVDIRLADDDLQLVVGRAGVVRLRSGSPEPERAWTAILQWVDLDPDSRDLLDRLEARETAEGVPPFRLAEVLQAPHGPVFRVDGGGRRSGQADERSAAEEVAAPAADGGGRSRDSFDQIGTMVSTALGADRSAATAADGDRGSSSGRRPRGGRTGRLAQITGWAVGLGAVAVLVAAVALLWLPELADRNPGQLPVATPTTGFHSPGADPATPTAAAEAPLAPATTPSTAPARPETTPTRAAAAPDPEVVAAPPTPEPPAPTSAHETTEAPGPIAILALDVEESEDGAVVVVHADRSLASGAVSQFRLDAPPGPRAVVQIRGVAASALPNRLEIDGPSVTAVRTWLHDELDPPELHVVVDLADPALTMPPVELRGPDLTVRLVR